MVSEIVLRKKGKMIFKKRLMQQARKLLQCQKFHLDHKQSILLFFHST